MPPGGVPAYAGTILALEDEPNRDLALENQ
jgi:hypothetical protein